MYILWQQIELLLYTAGGELLLLLYTAGGELLLLLYTAGGELLLLLYTAGVDYEITSVDLLFDADTATVCVRIPVDDDNILEEEERFDISLTTNDTAITLSPEEQSVTIIDNDGMSLSIITVLIAGSSPCIVIYRCYSWS